MQGGQTYGAPQQYPPQQQYWEGDPGYAARAALNDNLTTEQEMLKAMLPATRVHQSFKAWVTPQMLCVRVATKHGHKHQRDTRVVCITPTILFLVHPIGEVRRFIKMAQVESAVASEVLLAGRRLPHLLIKCAHPEHDILLTFLPDRRNVDPREGPATVLKRLEQVKKLRGEYFPVQRTQGNLFAQANLTKSPHYVAPKRRLDRALVDLSTAPPPGEPEYGPDGEDPVDFLGTCAGRMGGEDPQPVPSVLGSPVRSPQPAAAARAGALSQMASPQQQRATEHLTFMPPPAAVPVGSPAPAAPPGGAPMGWPVSPPPTAGAPAVSFSPVPPGSTWPAADQSQLVGSPQPPMQLRAYSVRSGPSASPGAAPRGPAVISHRRGMSPGELRAAEEMEDFALEERRRRDAMDAKRWDTRAAIAQRCNSPRPEDLGGLAAERSPRPAPPEHNGHDFGYGAEDNVPAHQPAPFSYPTGCGVYN
eukprot:TRINITY_DN6346_c1_g1_i1.p1 TRINITY_DN6346_c1_g1~~TRINITY_DN6346_c1_g1_i1.p1  ORF type:complete len:513 (+),score=129.48 TRINITY_DN6346_c1_g1_i1:114-1541(+)